VPGGGRSLEGIVTHVLDAERSYASMAGGRVAKGSPVHDAFVAAVVTMARGEVPATGPRGGRRWPTPYAIRRAAWHVLDHAWELEDRTRPI